jgi:hypothetical protein
VNGSSKAAPVTFLAGMALLIPASLGLKDIGPTILSPLPALTILPAFLLQLRNVAMVIPMLLFFAWRPGLFLGEGEIPKRSYALLAVAIVLSIIWFVGGWKFGMEFQGARYTYAVCIVNLVWACVLALAFVANWKKESSFKTNLILHWLLFAWLAWYAFPYLGELP